MKTTIMFFNVLISLSAYGAGIKGEFVRSVRSYTEGSCAEGKGINEAIDKIRSEVRSACDGHDFEVKELIEKSCHEEKTSGGGIYSVAQVVGKFECYRARLGKCRSEEIERGCYTGGELSGWADRWRAICLCKSSDEQEKSDDLNESSEPTCTRPRYVPCWRRGSWGCCYDPPK